MDRDILKKLLNTKVQIINDENFVKVGIITEVFENSVSFFSNGKTYYLSFDRIKEIRPLGGQK